MHATNIVEWNKKRKLHSHQLDLLRPKHKCWIGSFSSEHASMFDGNLVLESTHDHIVKSRTDAAFLDDRSKPESAKDSNSFIEDSDTAMSVNEEAKVEADSANTYLFGRLSTSFGCSDDNNGAKFYSLHLLLYITLSFYTYLLWMEIVPLDGDWMGHVSTSPKQI